MPYNWSAWTEDKQPVKSESSGYVWSGPSWYSADDIAKVKGKYSTSQLVDMGYLSPAPQSQASAQAPTRQQAGYGGGYSPYTQESSFSQYTSPAHNYGGVNFPTSSPYSMGAGTTAPVLGSPISSVMSSSSGGGGQRLRNTVDDYLKMIAGMASGGL